MFIAHRGSVTDGIRENSIEAFKNAISDKRYQRFELDIRETWDHEVIVLHDFLIGGNVVSKLKYKDIVDYGIIKLEDVLKLDTNKIILIEIKDFKMDLDNLIRLLNKYKEKNIYVMSFDKRVINKFREYDSGFKCGVLNYIFNRDIDYTIYDFVVILNSFLTDNIVDYFINRGVMVFSYGIISNYNLNNKDVYYIIDNKDF